MKSIKFFLFFIFISVNAFSDSTFIFRDNNEDVYIGKSIYILKDESNKLSFEEVRNNPNFVLSDQKVPNLGLTNSSIWIKVIIKNESDIENLIVSLATPLIDKIEFYEPGLNNQYKMIKLGQSQPFDKRKYKQPTYLFDLNVPKGESKILFFKIDSKDQIEIPLSVSSTINSFDSISLQNVLFGIYAGLMLIMILYNLFIYLTVDDRSYLYYVVYILSVFLTQASFQGYTFKYLWPDFPQIEGMSILLCSIFVGYASVEFLRFFLNTKKIVPKYDKIFFVAYIFYFIALIITLSGYQRIAWGLILGIVSPLSMYMLFISFKIARMGYRTARFFTIAWSIFLIGVFIYTLKDFGLLPYNYITKYTMPFGSAIETVLLSFALADRIKTLQRDKELTLRENERIVKEQNVFLETKVNERTRELKKANDELNVTLVDLKETQSQLVNSEKMASLGQLTAGVAHEINNPINFVSSSIKPLRRDINDLLLILSKYEEINENNLIDKSKEISVLKTDLDIEYVKSEIQSLLKGIDEGASRTAEIVKGLKTFSRIDETDLKRVDLNEGIDSTLILLNSLMNGKIDIVKEYGEIPKIECYAGKINQVFMNILNNAIHAVINMPKRDEQGKIFIKTLEKGSNVMVCIKDNGPGIPKDIRSKIFDPFFTTKDVGEGTGLGLSIVYNIIESHHGKIELESNVGIGTEFIITLPKLQSN